MINPPDRVLNEDGILVEKGGQFEVHFYDYIVIKYPIKDVRKKDKKFLDNIVKMHNELAVKYDGFLPAKRFGYRIIMLRVEGTRGDLLSGRIKRNVEQRIKKQKEILKNDGYNTLDFDKLRNTVYDHEQDKIYYIDVHLMSKNSKGV